MTLVLNFPHFQDEQAAHDYVESLLWPTGPVCPHCGNCDGAKIGKLNGKTTRAGLRKCYECRKPFSVKMGTIFEDTRAPLRYWLQAIHLMCSSKKGISTRQLQRTPNCSMKTAWFMGHRIRLAMALSGDAGPIGGAGKTVEADKTYLSKSPETRKSGPLHARPDTQVFSLVERGGAIRSTRELAWVVKHESVEHSKYEWARGDVYTNSLENLFNAFKRGLVGVYQHMDEKHLDRYLSEFDFRRNTRAKLGINDPQRTAIALQRASGSRIKQLINRRLLRPVQLVFIWEKK
jgi:hypothetical protein